MLHCQYDIISWGMPALLSQSNVLTKQTANYLVNGKLKLHNNMGTDGCCCCSAILGAAHARPSLICCQTQQPRKILRSPIAQSLMNAVLKRFPLCLESLLLYEPYANVSSQICHFLALRRQFQSNPRVNLSTLRYCQSATFGRLTFCVYPLLFLRNSRLMSPRPPRARHAHRANRSAA